ncbi:MULTISPECIES: WbqC family protein [Bacteroides]|jgi:WbqC-like protein family protein|uniref:WbqC family protein n=1 Tax=Bacteroides TaxID=816 RepID=UPI0008D0C2FF|nr:MULTISPECIES: WbqC family protein [Bacteroides]MCE8777537.1 WbqC family protein [Bacteroides thetaiotaomicron]SEM84107.1 WbqC-like protein family protein [Bacteroides sp. AR20]
MKLGIMQPYFMPYIGYFQLMKAVDKYVVYDDVNYIKGGWANRNHILINGEKEMFTVTLQKASQNKLFNEIVIGDDFKKLMKTLQMNYSRAINFDQTMVLMERIISFPNKQLAVFIANSFREILSYLSVETEILMSSEIPKDNSLRGKDKIIQICEILGADTYYNAVGGKNLYDQEEFREHGITLNFVDSLPQVYSQLHTREFVSGLSMIDVLMNNTKDKVNSLLESYQIKY